MPKPMPRGGFTAVEVAMASFAILAFSALLLPTLHSACGAPISPVRNCGGTASIVAVRMESLRQHVEHVRMRLIDAYDRRFNASVPCE